MTATTYSQDIAYLRQHVDVVELATPGGGSVAVAPDYQGRVMTSAAASDLPGYGWINRRFIDRGRSDAPFNNYGGEDRFWMGPEVGPYSLWWRPGAEQIPANQRTPEAFNAGRFDVTSQGAASIAMAREMEVANAAGTTFRCAVKRTIDVIDADAAGGQLGLAVPDGVDMVAFSSTNVLANVGDRAWLRDGGLLSIWVLGQFRPLPAGRVIIPFAAGPEELLGRRAWTDYFGPVPADRCAVRENYLTLAADGAFCCKVGVGPGRAKDVLGSWDEVGRLLTVVQFNLPGGADTLPWVNSHPALAAEEPFAGDVVNSYNDGPVGAQEPLGPFYELETSSPAAELAPGQAMTHIQRTFHFHGPAGLLNDLSRGILGVDLGDVT